ncbi:MAG: (d)CMP kinase [Chitinophagales bacterium]
MSKDSNNKIIIAIDGHASCGKSTLARGLARELNYLYITSGAMYRAVTLYLLDNKIDYKDLKAVKNSLSDIHIRFKYNPTTYNADTYLNDVNVESRIRDKEVSDHVSPVSTIKVVRTLLVKQQHALGNDKGITMDGRDIGTIVFPDAELKIFLTASAAVRAERRFKELKENGMERPFEEVLKNVTDRDRIDSTRKVSPLRQAKDSVVIDNSNISRDEQLAMILALAKKRIKQNKATNEN